MPSAIPVRLNAHVTGRVQGVSFRAFTRQQASALGLKGWVRNLPDGSVEVVAEGPRVALENLVAALHKGPPLAHVSQVGVQWGEATGQVEAFRIR